MGQKAARVARVHDNHTRRQKDILPKGCPNCFSERVQSTVLRGPESGLAFRCNECNVRFVITNPSYMKDE